MKKTTHILAGVSLLAATTSFAQKNAAKATKPVQFEINKTHTTSSGLKFTLIQKGRGEKVEKGDMATVNYVGKFTNDSVFENSYDTKRPFTFKVGQQQAIAGWDEALQLMYVGDKAKIVVPPALGYGDQQRGAIPANSTLLFDVEVMSVKKGVKPYETKSKDTVRLASGLKYLVIQKGTGTKPQKSDIVTVEYSAFLPDGKMFDSSIDRGDPIKFPLGKSMPGLDEAVGQMQKDQKIRAIIPYKLAFGEEGRAGVIPPKTDIIFDIHLVEFKTPAVIAAFDVKGKDTVKTASGLKYIVVHAGISGVKAQAGKTVKVHYTGYLLDGTIFDSSVQRDEPIEFPLGQGAVIPGWDEGIQLMSISDKYRLIIPSDLAYGDAGSPPSIPAKATLIFDVELVDVK